MLDEFPASGVCWALEGPAHGKLRNFLLQRCPTIPDRVNGSQVVSSRCASRGSKSTLADKRHCSQHHNDQWQDTLNVTNWETVPDPHSHLGSHMPGRAKAIWVWFGLVFKSPLAQPPLAHRTADWQVLHCWAGCSWCPLDQRCPRQRECKTHMYY